MEKTAKMQSIWKKISLLLAVAALVLPVAAVSAQAGGVGGRVANPDPDNPHSTSIFFYNLEPGDTIEDQLLVVNQTDEAQAVEVRSVDGILTNTGDFTCRQAVEPVVGSGSWVTLSQDEVVVPARSDVLVDFQLTVPNLVDVGEHNSCLTVQIVDQVGEDVGSGILLLTRQGVRVAVNIPGEQYRNLSITEFSVNQEDDGQKYVFAVKNDGNVSASVDMRVRLTSVFGREVIATGGEYPILPTERFEKNFVTQYRPMFGGWFDATPSIRYDTRLGFFSRQQIDAEYETITSQSVRIFFWPTPTGWAVMAGSLVSFIIGFWLLGSQLRLKALLRKSAQDYVVQDGDTIQSLSHQVGINWRDLAQLNKLAAPYSLTPGQTIKLPALNILQKKKKAKKKDS